MKASVERFKAFLIDWDGTLIDSLPIKIENAAGLFGEHFGVHPKDVSTAYRRHSGVPRRILFDRIASDCVGHGLSEDEFAELSRTFTDRNRSRLAAEGSLRPGTLEALARLQKKGAMLFISTSAAQDEIDALAHHFGLDRLCAAIFGSKPGFSKGREHVRHVMEVFGFDLENLAGIGDDIQDMTLFNEAGIFAIGITGTRSKKELEQAGASLVIDNTEEVISRVA